MEKSSKTMTTKELTAAVNLLLEREEKIQAREEQEKREAVQNRRRALEENIEKLTTSVTVIKWCIVGITTVVALAMITVILIISELNKGAQQIRTKIDAIEREAEMIREKIRHPLETVGGAVGRKLDEGVKGMLSPEEK